MKTGDKRNFLYYVSSIFIVMAFCVLSSCADSFVEKEDNVASEIFDNPTFRVNENIITTYTSLGPDLKILWQEGDQIGIFCNSTVPAAINERAILNEYFVGQNTGVFNSDLNWGSGSHNFSVYYPWKSEVGTAANSIHHTLQTVQTQRGSDNSRHIGKNAFMYARTNAAVYNGYLFLDFIHTTCVFEISFKSDFPEVYGKPLTKIVLKESNGATLSGDFTMNLTGNNVPAFSSVTKSDSIVLNLEDAHMPGNSTDSLKAYLVVNPAYMNKAIIKYTVDGEEYTLTKDVNRQLSAQKVYKIMTKVDYGTISASPSIVYLSPAHPSQAVTVKSTHPWTFNGAGCAVATSPQSGGNAGEASSLTLTRKTSQMDFNVFGSSVAKLTTVGENPKSTSVRVENLFLSVPEPLYIGNPVGADTTVYIPDIVAYGGEGKFVVESFTGDWIESMVYDEVSAKLKAKVKHNSTNTDRPGTVTIHHSNDPDYKVTVQILQNEFVYIPEFKFFVLDIQWCKRPTLGLDVDIAYLFEGNDPRTPFEDMPVGYGDLHNDPRLNKPSNWNSLYVGSTSGTTGRSVQYTTASNTVVPLINWGGDATQGQGETVYFDAEAFHNATNVPRYLNMGLYLTWWAHPADINNIPVE
ncbi:MAG: fimbrillin family protein, partial [Tannerella sp.]|nr:fimbrillin family protein [Tannerella sp.]